MKKDSYYSELESQGYYETIDKRSKDYREYKEWKASFPKVDYTKFNENVSKEPKGLGDIVAKVTEVTGIKKVVKFLAGDDCGCDERQAKWNEIPMFKRKTPECIQEDDYNYLINFFKTTVSKVKMSDYSRIVTIHNYIFKTNEPTKTSCNSCAAKITNRLKIYLNTYK
jgi:hypothetical protein